MPLWRNAAAILNKVAQKQSIYSLPININHVRDAINELCGGADIRYYFVDIDAEKVRGYFKKGYITSGPYASESQLIGNVYVSINQTEEWQNFVAVKEMLHLMDSEKYSTHEQQAIANLLEDMSSPVDDFMSVDTSHPRGQMMITDHVAAISAVEVLFPYEVRKFLRQQYEETKIADYELMQVAAMPDRWVRWAMSPRCFEMTEQRRIDRQIQDILPPPVSDAT
jgi:hypothetical protein